MFTERSRATRPVVLTLGLLFLFSINHAFSMDLSGVINGTLYSANNPHIVTSSIIVEHGQTLTVQPGVIIKFSKGTGIKLYGTLTALGTSSSDKDIEFTSNETYPSSNDWFIDNYSSYTAGRIDDINLTLENCNIRYCSSVKLTEYYPFTLHLDVTIKNCNIEIEDQLLIGSGLELFSFTGNTVTSNNSTSAITIRGGYTLDISDNTILETEINFYPYSEATYSDSITCSIKSNNLDYLKLSSTQDVAANNYFISSNTFDEGIWLDCRGKTIVDSNLFYYNGSIYVKNNLNSQIIITDNCFYTEPDKAIITYAANGPALMVTNNYWAFDMQIQMGSGGNLPFFTDNYDNSSYGSIDYSNWLALSSSYIELDNISEITMYADSNYSISLEDDPTPQRVYIRAKGQHRNLRYPAYCSIIVKSLTSNDSITFPLEMNHSDPTICQGSFQTYSSTSQKYLRLNTGSGPVSFSIYPIINKSYLQTIENGSGIKPLINLQSPISRFPSIIEDKLSIELEGNKKDYKFLLCSLTGEIIFSQNITPSKSTIEINLSSYYRLNTGKYYMVLYSSNSVETKDVLLLRN